MQFSKKTFLGILVISLLTTAVASAQTIAVVSGDGQVAPQNFAAQSPMIAVVKNFQGQPQPGTTVTWTIISGAGNLLLGLLAGSASRSSNGLRLRLSQSQHRKSNQG